MGKPPPRRSTLLDRYHRLVERITADPDLTGELLLLAILMAEQVVFNAGGTVEMAKLGNRIFGDRPSRSDIVALLKGDIRRYDFRADPGNAGRTWAVPCESPMIRREGLCGKRSSTTGLMTELETGRRLWSGACTRHRDWWYQAHRDNRAAVQALGDRLPTPAANAGGLLARHFPAIDWEDYWRKLDPTWVAPPEAKPHVPPTFKLVLGGAEGEAGGEVARPTLVLHRGDKPDPPPQPKGA